MVFKKMLQKLGVGGPSVDTVLADPRCMPGDSLSGEVRLLGGDGDAEIEHIALSLVTRVERGDSGQGMVEFHRVVVAGPTRLAAKQERTIPFTIPVPWEVPVTEVGGQRLPRMELGLRTEVSIAKAVDKGDLDPVYVVPLESQDAVLEGFGQLGFHFKSADLEAGRIYGIRQELPFFQEIEFYPPSQFAGRINEVELTMVAAPGGLTVVLEADKRSGMFGGGGGDFIGRFEASHREAVDMDWARIFGEWLDSVASRRGNMMQGYDGHHGHHGDGYHGHHGGHRGGGMGGIVAGAAAGVLGGMMIGEMFDGGDDEGGGEEEG
ncbi:sporulation-control protein [Kibdelosporangium banguiense]|uniref:Sporulation-control protein n=1 Tax=Kibdelosporangium banguiense TaxID=1365924 RepID=A0ABS4TL70_9PSEU|nr:sporulation protein [Kibdelosporangium banguiense]MBP2325156.1 sporulation-control protein [Kibdelosporangium banguiense]